MSLTNVSELGKIRTRVAKTLAHGIQLNMSTDESKKLLKRHVNRKTNVVIMIVDVNNSTSIFRGGKVCVIVQTFAQEISIAVAGYVDMSSNMKVMRLLHFFLENMIN